MFAADQGATPTATTYVDDVFSAYLYTTNSSVNTINNNIELGDNWYVANPTVQSFSNGLMLMPFDTGSTVSEKLSATYSGLSTATQLSPTIFGAVNTGVKLAGGSALRYGTASMTTGTIEYWIYGDVASNYPECNLNGTTPASYSLFVLAGGNFYSSNAGASWDISGPLSVLPTLGRWNHIAISWGSSVYRLFVNGALSATVNQANAPYGTFICPLQYNVSGNNNGFSNLLVSSTNKYTTGFTVPNGPWTYSGVNTSLGYTVGKGGMVWFKSRSLSANNAIFDTNNGVNKMLTTDTTAAIVSTSDTFNSFNSNGFTLGTDPSYQRINRNSMSMVSWTFRKAPKFFDVVTYTGNGTAGRTIAHSLGVAPGMIIVKQTTGAVREWNIYHRSLLNTQVIFFDTGAAANSPSNWNSTTPTATAFTLGTNVGVNGSGDTYVAYLFAHDTAADGIVQCGSFTTDGSGIASVTLGWEPQFVMMKSSGGTGGWYITDSARPFLAAPATTTQFLSAESSSAEGSWGTNMSPIATGFTTSGLPVTREHIYLAIRRPNKPPTVGTQVYSALARAGTGATATITGLSFPPDLAIGRFTNGTDGAGSPAVSDRLRGIPVMDTALTNAENSYTGGEPITSWRQDGVALGTGSFGYFNRSGNNYINWFFKRAPGVFDVVCFTTQATGSSANTKHSLGVTPEMVIIKDRAGTNSWLTYHTGLTSVNYLLQIEQSNGQANTTALCWTLSSTEFQIATNQLFGSRNHVAYLFASKTGISKVGSYTGNGSSQTINAGFTTGARFILIKRTDSTGDWYVWDSVRGIVSANDPHLSLNTAVAEVTTNDSIDPDTSGFIVNQLAATNINVTSATYIYLSFA